MAGDHVKLSLLHVINDALTDVSTELPSITIQDDLMCLVI